MTTFPVTPQSELDPFSNPFFGTVAAPADPLTGALAGSLADELDTGIATLRDDDRGRWVVTTTQNSTYLLDLDARTATRTPTPEHAAVFDGEPMRLLELARCELGKTAMMSLDLYGAGGGIIRMTTEVTDIRPAD